MVQVRVAVVARGVAGGAGPGLRPSDTRPKRRPPRSHPPRCRRQPRRFRPAVAGCAVAGAKTVWPLVAAAAQ